MRLARAALALSLVASAGCWNWSRFEQGRDAAAGDTGVPADASGACEGVVCACAGDVCVAGACVPEHRVADAAGGHQYMCFVTLDQTIYCMGDNERGQLGIAVSEGEAEPVRASSSGFDRIAGGDYFLALLDPSGASSYWGIRPGSNLAGIPDTSATDLGGTFTLLAAGGEHACGVRSSGRLACTGDNSSGQLGTGDHGGASVFVDIAPSVTGWARVSLGLAHSCGVAGGNLYCWGDDTEGPLGLGDTAERAAPTQLSGTGWTEVDAGKDFTCAVLGGQAYCFGNNGEHQCGQPDTSGRILEPSEPLRVDGAPLDGVVSVSAGRFHACAMRDDRSIWCWGSNDCGAIGDGTGTPRAEPYEVPSDPRDPWARVFAGHHITCATRESGAIYCWGRGGDRMAVEDSLCAEGGGLEPPWRVPTRLCL